MWIYIYINNSCKVNKIDHRKYDCHLITLMSLKHIECKKQTATKTRVYALVLPTFSYLMLTLLEHEYRLHYLNRYIFYVLSNHF